MRHIVHGTAAGNGQRRADFNDDGIAAFIGQLHTIQVDGEGFAAGNGNVFLSVLHQRDGRAVRSRVDGLGEGRVIGIRAVTLLHGRDNRVCLLCAANRALAAHDGVCLGGQRAVVGIASAGVGAVAVVGVNVAVAVAVTAGTAAGRLSRLSLGNDVGLVVGDGLAVDGQAGRAVRDYDFRALGSAGDLDVLGDDEHETLAVSLDGRACLVSVGADGTVEDGDGGRAVDVVLRGKLVSRHTAHDTGLNERGNIALRVGGDLRGVGVLRQVGLADRLNAERAGQHDHGTLAGDGRFGRHGAVAVAVEDTGSRAAVDGIIVPGIRRVVGEARVLRGGQLEQLREDGCELCAGELTVGVKLPVAALDDAVGAPAFDGAFGPMACGVAVGRFDRSCADREQTNCHGEHKNEG